jgi:heme-degrading monooxygenase HmoA
MDDGRLQMVVVVFRSRLRETTGEAFQDLADRMHALASSMPGFISYKVYVAEDGERVSIHEWESAAHLWEWREHPEHRRAQEQGRGDFYSDYTLYVCEDPRTSRFTRQAGRKAQGQRPA